VLDGHRPLLVEVQALVARSELPSPRRSAQGLDQGRLALVLAVLQEHVDLPFEKRDVHTVVAGGVRATEPGVDLAIALALASARDKVPVPGDVVACGEVGLGGELRQVHQTARRLTEAARLGFRRAVVPASAPLDLPGIEVLRVRTLEQAVRLVCSDELQQRRAS
jgi:DNA repair protein RadA/Sms